MDPQPKPKKRKKKRGKKALAGLNFTVLFDGEDEPAQAALALQQYNFSPEAPRTSGLQLGAGCCSGPRSPSS